MIITPTISLTIIVAMAFIVYGYCLTQLAPILQKVIQAKKANEPEVLIQGYWLKVNIKLLASTILPYVVYVGCVLLYIWIIGRII